MLSWAKAIFNEVNYLSNYKFYVEPENPYENFPDLSNSDKLVIGLHGLNGQPSQFRFHAEKLEGQDIKIWLPPIFKKGMASPEECGDILLDQMNLHPDLKVVLVGISNGGRIAMYLYSKIKDQVKDIYLTGIGSPILGTKTADLMLKTKLYWLSNYSWDVLSEIRYGSETNQRLVRSCEEDENFKNKTLFYVSSNDWVVYPITCGFLEGHNYKVMEGVGHNFLVITVVDDQVNWILEKLA